jgi:hypothetical protein
MHSSKLYVKINKKVTKEDEHVFESEIEKKDFIVRKLCEVNSNSLTTVRRRKERLFYFVISIYNNRRRFFFVRCKFRPKASSSPRLHSFTIYIFHRGPYCTPSFACSREWSEIVFKEKKEEYFSKLQFDLFWEWSQSLISSDQVCWEKTLSIVSLKQTWHGICKRNHRTSTSYNQLEAR